MTANQTNQLIDQLNRMSDKQDAHASLIATQHTELLGHIIKLQTQMEDVYGGQQPGRLGRVESDVSSLKQTRSRWLGYCSALGAMAGSLVALILHFFPSHK